MIQDVLRLDLGFVNAYVLLGNKGPVLVDTGLGMQWEALLRGLEAAGCPPSSLALVLLTHGDQDHAGNARRLREEYGVKVAAHRAEAPALESGVAPPRTMQGFGRRSLFGILQLLRKLRGGKDSFPGFRPDVLLEEGSDLSPWGLEAEVIHLPGHTRGSIAFLTKSAALLSGDVVANRRRPATSPFVMDADAYRASLAKLKAAARRADTVYPGHGQPFAASALEAVEFGG
jgi:glyoxylase-like metal-dependent hydrolase (beta-lactamase superfamily II)